MKGASPYTRILLRYLAGYLVLKQVLPEDLATLIVEDVALAGMVEVGIGAVAAAVVEVWFGLAKRFGWSR